MLKSICKPVHLKKTPHNAVHISIKTFILNIFLQKMFHRLLIEAIHSKFREICGYILEAVMKKLLTLQFCLFDETFNYIVTSIRNQPSTCQTNAVTNWVTTSLAQKIKKKVINCLFVHCKNVNVNTFQKNVFKRLVDDGEKSHCCYSLLNI